MKVTVERADLLKSLSHVNRVVERRNTIPILANVLIRAEKSSLNLKATDLDLEVIESIAAEALATIPEEFRRHIGNVRIQVDDFPSDDVEQAMSLETPFDLLGLYQVVSMMERGAGHVANDIDRIFLYRRPILDYWCESEDDLPHIVRHVLIHEIGHHIGMSDDDMEAIEARAEEESRRVQPGA